MNTQEYDSSKAFCRAIPEQINETTIGDKLMNFGEKLKQIRTEKIWLNRN